VGISSLSSPAGWSGSLPFFKPNQTEVNQVEKLKQAELIRKIADETGETQTAVKNILFVASELIKKHTSRGKAVVFPGLGYFKPIDRAARTGRNPKTGEQFDIPAKRALVFKASSKAILDSE
jgi:DNA-binding protein HU-beta